MIFLKEISPLTTLLSHLRANNETIGFVPTMGALHAGHLSLIQASKNTASVTVCSLFVNPTQFNDPKDFENYPSTLSNDLLLLERAGCNIAFVPSSAEIYPGGLTRVEHYNLGAIEYRLEGAFRPGHFQGVCQVVDRLLSLVQPRYIYMGQKDYQQCLVVKRLITLKHQSIKMMICKTTREQSGLAMSSRNLRLTEREKEQATAIVKMLEHVKSEYLHRPFDELKEEATAFLLGNGFSKVDYVEIANADSLETAIGVHPKQQLIALVAAFIGKVRLIDNVALN